MNHQLRASMSTRWASFLDEDKRVACALYSEWNRVYLVVKVSHATGGQFEVSKVLLQNHHPFSTVLCMSDVLKQSSSTTVTGSFYATDESKKLTWNLFSVEFCNKDFLGVSQGKLLESRLFDEFPKRITSVYSLSSFPPIMADVHGTLFTCKVTENAVHGQELISRQLIARHTCQVSTILCLSTMSDFRNFIGGRATAATAESPLMIIGDKDGFLRVVQIPQAEQILSVCVGHITEVVSVTYEIHVQAGIVSDFFLISIDSSGSLVIHNAYSGEVMAVTSPRGGREVPTNCQKKYHLVKLKQDEQNHMICLCSLSDADLQLHRINIPSGTLDAIGSIQCRGMEQMLCLYNSPIEMVNFGSIDARARIPLFYSIFEEALHTITLHFKKYGESDEKGVLVEEVTLVQPTSTNDN